MLSHADSTMAGPAPAPPALALPAIGKAWWPDPLSSRQAVSSQTHPGSSLISWFHTVDTEQASGGLHILSSCYMQS